MKPRIAPLHKQRGIAMITAMMIVAICVTVVASIFVQQRYSIRLASNFQDLEQTYQYAYAAEDLAGVLLKRDHTENKHDSLFDVWASKDIEPFEIDDDDGQQIGVMQIAIEDMQGRFNVNNLIKRERVSEGTADKPRETVRRAFQMLLQNLDLPTSFSNDLIDWMDTNDEPFETGVESAYYQALEKPYSATNDFLVDTREMVRVKMGDITDNLERKEKLEGLMPHVIALPTPTTINVNTASREVLLATGIAPNQIDIILNLRESQPIPDMNMLEQSTGRTVAMDAKNKSLLGFASNYFRLSGEVRLGKSRLFLNSLLFRSPEGDVRVIMRQFSRVPKPKIEKPAFSG